MVQVENERCGRGRQRRSAAEIAWGYVLLRVHGGGLRRRKRGKWRSEGEVGPEKAAGYVGKKVR